MKTNCVNMCMKKNSGPRSTAKPLGTPVLMIDDLWGDVVIGLCVALKNGMFIVNERYISEFCE